MGSQILKRECVVKNKLGFHARPASLFVQTAMKFNSDIQLIKEGESPADGKSLISLLVLAAVTGTKLIITAEGPDAAEALQALGDLVDRQFDEE